MKNKIEISPAARTGQLRGLRRRRVFGILSAMGLMSATALIGAERFSNSFVTVEGDGVRIADDGSIHFPNAESPVAVEVTARPGWKVNGSESVSFTRAPGDGGPLRVTSDLGEDSYCIPLVDCQFGNDVSNRHVAPPAISIEGSERLIYMYALPGSNVLVSASATCETVSNGVHEIVTKWLPCPGCHALHDPAEETNMVSVAPEIGLWTASGAGVTTNASTWTAEMAKGNGQEITFRVDATNDCAECRNNCHASTNVVVDVYELSVTNDLYIGIDRTDAGRTNLVANAKTATALIAPAPSGEVSYSWKNCGICSFTGRTDQAAVRYFAPNPDVGSAAYLAEPLTVEATIEDGDLSASATCTTNFTVVKVDVSLGNWGEQMDEKNGAIIGSFVKRDGTGLFGGYPELAKNAMTQFPVCVGAFPTVLPADETLSLQFADNNLIVNDTPEVAQKCYNVNDVESQKFYLFDESGNVGVKSVDAVHDRSSARDKIVYDVCCCTFTLYTDCSEDFVGHSFWKIDVDSAHRENVPEQLRKYIGKPYGFYPSYSDGAVHDVEGLLLEESSHYQNLVMSANRTASHVWHIPFEGCVKGLEQVYRIAQDKPRYDLACFSCADAALSVGLACGVPVPAAGFPDLSIVEIIRIWFKDWEGTIDLSALDGMYSSPFGLLVNLYSLNEMYGVNE